MHQPVLLDADVHKGAEGGDVGDDARQGHPFAQVVDRPHVGSEGEGVQLLAGVEPPFVERLEDVGHGGEPGLRGDVAFGADRAPQLAVGEQALDAYAGIGGHAFDDRVGFGVHGAVVQRVPASDDAQEPGRLLEGLGPEARYLLQLAPCTEVSVRGPVGDDVLGQGGPEARDVGEDVFRGGVDIDSHAVHAAFYHISEPGPEFRLVHAVLVLADADRLGVDLHQLRQRVDQPSADAHGAADGYVLVGELLAGRGRCGVDRGAVFADRVQLHTLKLQSADELFGFAAGRSVADGHRLRAVTSCQTAERLGCLGRARLGRVGVDDRMVEQVPLCVERHDLASGAEPGVEGDDALLPER